MATNSVKYQIDIIGNALKEIEKLTGKTEDLGNAAERVTSKFAGIGRGFVVFNQAMEIVGKFNAKMKEFADANRAQVEAETKLGQVMRNTMGASLDEFESIKELASEQQKLGVIGDEVQLAGAQELGTYLSKTASLKKLMPVMNDMVAQQYGMAASQEQATQIASMLGKVMEGQVGALSRYGYKFDEAQEKILKYGTEEERVATLAEVIEQSVGGMNEALANTPEGRVHQVSMAMGDIKEKIGGLWMQLQVKLVPAAMAMLRLVDKLIAFAKKGWPVWVGVAVASTIAVAKVKKELEKVMVRLGGTSIAAVGTGGAFKLMSVVAKSACRGISVAISSIPIVGWIAGAIALIIGLFTTLWNKCAAFRGFFTGIWEVVKNTVGNAWQMLKGKLEEAKTKIKDLWDKIVGKVKGGIAWVKEKIASIAAWFKEKMRPVWDFISGLWENVKVIFGKVVDWMGKVFNPIITLWNKLTKGNVEKYKSGYAAGAAAVKKKDQELEGLGVIPGDEETGGGGGYGKAGAAVESAVTGGTRSTTVNISLGKMIEQVVFNGSWEESSAELESKVQECLYRVLALAATV